MKPTIVRNRQIFDVGNHLQSKHLGSTLSEDLRKKFGRRSIRVVKGDTVKVLRGEFRGIDGKVTKVSAKKNRVAIEGIKREKLKGGNVDILIHSSNLMITGMNLDDKWRQNKLDKQGVKIPKTEKDEVTNNKIIGLGKETEKEIIEKQKKVPDESQIQTKKESKQKKDLKSKGKEKNKW